MHDPSTLAHHIELPIPFTQEKLYKARRRKRITLLTIWHVDPCKPGPWRNDDSCGWFMRAGHGNPEMLKRIEGRFGFEWNCAYQPWFTDAGDPALSTMGITLNMFWCAAFEMFGRKKADKWMRKNLFDILWFAENTTDTLATSIQGKYGEDKQPKEERIKSFAAIVYSYILRDTRPWYKHPRWHIHHWKVQVPWLQYHWRALFSKCCMCGKRIGWTHDVIGDWDGTKIWHGRCDSATRKEKDE